MAAVTADDLFNLFRRFVQEGQNVEGESSQLFQPIGQFQRNGIVEKADRTVIIASNREGNSLSIRQKSFAAAFFTADPGLDRAAAEGHQRQPSVNNYPQRHFALQLDAVG